MEFEHNIVDGFNVIRLVRGEKQLAYIRYSIEEKEIVIEYIYSSELRKGYGSLLVNRIKEIAREQGKPITLLSLSAHKFWRKQGFKVIGSAPDRMLRMKWK